MAVGAAVQAAWLAPAKKGCWPAGAISMRSLATVLLMCAATVRGQVKPSGKMTNGGTPPGVPPTFDCKARAAAWEYGKYLLPERGDFRTLFEALQL